MEKIKEKIGIFILNYNGLKYLKKTIPLLIRYNEYESDIIIIDNNSQDQSINYIQKKFSHIKVKKLNKNYGFSKGYNKILLQENIYKYFIILNNDVEVSRHWISPMLDIIKKPNTGIVQPKIKNLEEPEFFDYAGAAGGYIDKLGIPFCRGRIMHDLEKDINQYDNIQKIFWASGCCLMIKKDVFQQLNGFDEDFFMHQEEIDLCWRLQSTQHEVIFCPKSTVYHFGGATLSYSSPIKHYYNHRNSLLLIIKNLPLYLLSVALPTRIILDYLAMFYYLISGIKYFVYDNFNWYVKFFNGTWKWNQRGINNITISCYILTAHISCILLLPKFLMKRLPIHAKLIYPSIIIFDFFIKNKRKFSDLKKF